MPKILKDIVLEILTPLISKTNPEYNPGLLEEFITFVREPISDYHKLSIDIQECLEGVDKLHKELDSNYINTDSYKNDEVMLYITKELYEILENNNDTKHLEQRQATYEAMNSFFMIPIYTFAIAYSYKIDQLPQPTSGLFGINCCQKINLSKTELLIAMSESCCQLGKAKFQAALSTAESLVVDHKFITTLFLDSLFTHACIGLFEMNDAIMKRGATFGSNEAWSRLYNSCSLILDCYGKNPSGGELHAKCLESIGCLKSDSLAYCIANFFCFPEVGHDSIINSYQVTHLLDTLAITKAGEGSANDYSTQHDNIKLAAQVAKDDFNDDF